VEGWLQGFITTTTFTVWQRAFRWDSLAPENGFSVEEMTDRKWDSDNMLACELEMQDRAGDPDAEGIIWPKVDPLKMRASRIFFKVWHIAITLVYCLHSARKPEYNRIYAAGRNFSARRAGMRLLVVAAGD
jgi:hypothetical protein